MHHIRRRSAPVYLRVRYFKGYALSDYGRNVLFDAVYPEARLAQPVEIDRSRFPDPVLGRRSRGSRLSARHRHCRADPDGDRRDRLRLVGVADLASTGLARQVGRAV